MSKDIDWESMKIEGPESPLLRVSFPTLDKPKASPGSEEEKFSITGLLPKTDTAGIALFRRIHMSAMTQKFGPKEKWPKKPYTNPIADGDASQRPEYAGMWVIRMKNKDRVPLVDRRTTAILPDEIKAGYWVKVRVLATAWQFPHEGSPAKIGGSFKLKGIQLMKPDTIFGADNGGPGKGFKDEKLHDDDGSENEENYEDVAGF